MAKPVKSQWTIHWVAYPLWEDAFIEELESLGLFGFSDYDDYAAFAAGKTVAKAVEEYVDSPITWIDET